MHGATAWASWPVLPLRVSEAIPSPPLSRAWAPMLMVPRCQPPGALIGSIVGGAFWPMNRATDPM